MATTPDVQRLLDQHLRLMKEGDLAKLEELWLEQLPTLPAHPDFFKGWLQALKKNESSEPIGRGESLVAMLVEDRLERGRGKDALRILLASIPILPNSDVLRPLLVKTLRAQYSQMENLDALIQISGLEQPGSLVTAYKQFRDWTRLAPGQVYQHYDWGEGIVDQLDLAAGKVILDFPKEKGKGLTIDGVRKHLNWIEPKHFLARRAKESEALLAMGEDKPIELIKLVLAGQADLQIKQSELKGLLMPLVIPEKQWNSWWGKAREALALDPFVDFDRSGGARAVIRLREKPRTFAQELEESFFDAEIGVSARAELIRQLAKQGKEANLPLDLTQRMAKRLVEEWALAQNGPAAARLEIAFMMQDLAEAAPGTKIAPPDAEKILEGIEDYRELFAIDHHEYGERALTKLIKRDGEEGMHQAAQLLPQAPVKLAQAIWETMEEDHHADAGVQGLQKLFDRALENPETYAWALRATLDGSWKHLEDYFPAQAMIPELIEQMERWHQIADDATHPRERREAARKLLSRGRTMLGADHAELIGVAIEGMTRDQANRLRRQIRANPAFNAAFIAQAERTIGVVRRDLEEPEEVAAAAAAAGEGLFTCTAKAQTKAMAELREITSVLIPRNAKIIEEARMEGDLKENAGYQYAKEEQKMLVQKQATLSDMLRRAKIVRADEVDTARIGFGVRFTVRNLESGEDETYTLLGRWEADADRNILNEQAPLSMQFAGRKPGEKLRIQRPGAPATDYEVLLIENALANVEWTAAEA